jgi:predicted RNase H-like HicB family nuclease
MKYLVVIEPTATGFSAYSPDVPGCVATGGTLPEVESEIAGAILLHFEGLHAEGLAAPAPRASTTYVDVPAE